MATLSSAPRFTTATLASATAGPFNIGFRVFATSTATAKNALEVLVNGEVRTDFTVSGSFTAGYSDAATITFTAPLAIADVLDIYGNLHPQRQKDLISTGLTRLLNLELPRLWTSVADMLVKAKSSIRLAGGAAIPPITYDAGKMLIMQNGRVEAGPDATDIAQAQGYAAAAGVSATAAAGSVTAAQTAEANAEAWAGTVNSTFLQTSALRCTLGGTATAITLTTGGALLSILPGQKLRAKITTSCTGPSTLAVDGISPVSIKTSMGAPVAADYWIAGDDIEFSFDGTFWRAKVIGVTEGAEPASDLYWRMTCGDAGQFAYNPGFPPSYTQIGIGSDIYKYSVVCPLTIKDGSFIVNKWGFRGGGTPNNNLFFVVYGPDDDTGLLPKKLIFQSAITSVVSGFNEINDGATLLKQGHRYWLGFYDGSYNGLGSMTSFALWPDGMGETVGLTESSYKYISRSLACPEAIIPDTLSTPPILWNPLGIGLSDQCDYIEQALGSGLYRGFAFWWKGKRV